MIFSLYQPSGFPRCSKFLGIFSLLGSLLGTLWQFNIAMENHHFEWENPLFQWPFSIAMLVYQRVPLGTYGHAWLGASDIRPRFNDPAELTAFYHSVATFGLKFQLGDSLYDLAAPQREVQGQDWVVSCKYIYTVYIYLLYIYIYIYMYIKYIYVHIVYIYSTVYT